MKAMPMPTVITRILAPTDFSPDAVQSVTRAAELAQTLGAELILITAAPETTVADEVARGQFVDRVLETLRMQLAAWFTQRVSPAIRRGVPTKYLAVVGAPAEAVLEAAKVEGANLIVMATHGRSGLQRLMHGSVAETVVRAASIPVLTVRAGGVPARAAVPA